MVGWFRVQLALGLAAMAWHNRSSAGGCLLLPLRRPALAAKIEAPAAKKRFKATSPLPGYCRLLEL